MIAVTCGIYLIETRIGRFYIGQSKHVEKRIKSHHIDLKRSTHKNKKFQRSFSRNTGKFSSKILIICREQDLTMFEQIAMNALCPSLNGTLLAGKVDLTWRSDIKKLEKARKKIAKASEGRMTEELKYKLLQTHLGKPAWNKGLPMPEEQRAKLRGKPSKLKGLPVPEESLAKRRGKIPWNKGGTHTDETKEKMRKSHQGKALSEEHKASLRGPCKQKGRPGNKPWNTGRKLSKEQTVNMQGRVPWNKGKKVSASVKTNMKAAQEKRQLINPSSGTRNPNFGRRWSDEKKLEMSTRKKLWWEDKKKESTK